MGGSFSNNLDSFLYFMKNRLADTSLIGNNKKNRFFLNKCSLLGDVLLKDGDCWVWARIAGQDLMANLEVVGLEHIPYFFFSWKSGLKTHTGIWTFPWCSHPTFSPITCSEIISLYFLPAPTRKSSIGLFIFSA